MDTYNFTLPVQQQQQNIHIMDQQAYHLDTLEPKKDNFINSYNIGDQVYTPI